MSDLSPLTDELVAFLEGGRSLTVASRDAALRPTLAKAVAACVAADRSSITVLLPRSQSLQLLRDVAASGQIAAVFSQPGSHRTVQLKGNDAREVAASVEDRLQLERQRGQLVEELTAFGYPVAMLEAFLDCRADDLAAIRFTPQAAYNQTPGPKAGTRLGEA
ncbi:hypothetical protein [Chitinimonas sp.]|uniref:hypothetical protein n=1 Tax=Chitinimonas sp. TaxID=1934313 RepID=UPI002F92F611